MFSTNQWLEAQKQDRQLGLKSFSKIQINGRDLGKTNVAHPNDERRAAQALKALGLNRRATS